MTLFVRLLEVSPEEKPQALRDGVGKGTGLSFEAEPKSFADVPRSPFSYWTTAGVRECFRKFPPLKAGGRDASIGASTKNDFRYVRIWTEVASGTLGHDRAGTFQRSWVPFAKGGAFSRAYADLHLVINWQKDGEILKADISEYRGSRGWGYQWSAALNGHDSYFRPGLTWPLRTQAGFSIRVMPRGGLFAHKGPAATLPEDSPEELLSLLAVCMSQPFCYLVDLQMAFGSFEVGVIHRTPVPDRPRGVDLQLSNLARRAWSLKRLLDTTNETSHAFVLPPGILGYEASPLHPDAGGFNRADIRRELAEIQAEIDDKIFALYGISDEDRATIEASMSAGASSAAAADSSEDESPGKDDDSDQDDSESSVELTATTLTTYSWLVGVAFGRFDPRLATRKRAIPPEPEPFDPLPARSPGMWPEGEQPDSVPPDIMVDDPGHDHDIRMLVASAAAMTGWPNPEDLRQWLAKEFFPLHIKMYSKSRRKAPIYWQLATPTASYSVWLYIHAFTKDTLFRVQNDYVASKLAHEQRKLESLQSASQEGQTAAERKELAAQESFVEELRAFLDEVKRVAPLWNPNLDDGVIINFAPLWRLVPQHKPWQKELKSTWDALCAGKYDWAHLAMYLWPERVVPQCAKDRSLAIAHGLEEVFWVEGTDGKWTARKTPTTPVSELVQERTSPAVQDALKRLLSAPAPAAGRAKKKAPRKKTARKSSAAKTGRGSV